MEDRAIVELFWRRDENAVRESQGKYGPRLARIAQNILADREDAAECVNDAYWKAWASIPPQRPDSLGAYLTTLTRQGAIDALRRRESAKRGGGQYRASLEELGECVPGGADPAETLDAQALGAAINRFLGTLDGTVRELFVRRYYYFDSLRETAAGCGMSESRAKSALYRARQGLKRHLEQEGFTV